MELKPVRQDLAPPLSDKGVVGYEVGVVLLCCCHGSNKQEGAKFKKCVPVNKVVAFEVKLLNSDE